MSRHGILYIIGAGLQGLALLIATPFATRALGAGEYGRVAVALAVAQTLVSVLAAGFPQLILRDWERGVDGRFDARVTVGLMVAGGAGIAVVGSLVVVLLTVVGVVKDPGPAFAVALGSGGLTCIAACQAVLRAERKPVHFVLLATSSTLGAVLAGIGAAQISATAASYLTGYTTVLVVLGAASVLYSRPAWPWRERERIRRGLMPALALVPYGLAMMVLLSSDTIIAGTFRGAHGAATYQPALMLGNIVFTAASAVFNAWGPAVYRQASELRWRWMASSASLIALVLAAGAAIIAIGARWLVPILVGTDFDRGTIQTLVRILVWMGIPYVLYLGCSLVLIEHGRTGMLAAISSTTAVIFLVAGALTARFSGLAGLAVVKVAAHTALFLATWYAARRFEVVRLRGWPSWIVVVVAVAGITGTLSGAAWVETAVLVIALPVLAVAANAQLRRMLVLEPGGRSVVAPP